MDMIVSVPDFSYLLLVIRRRYSVILQKSWYINDRLTYGEYHHIINIQGSVVTEWSKCFTSVLRVASSSLI